MTSRRHLARRFGNFVNRNKGQIAWVSDPLGAGIDVPDTTNQIYIRILNDANQTHPAYNLTGITFVENDIVWVELRAAGNSKRGEYWILGEYTFTA